MKALVWAFILTKQHDLTRCGCGDNTAQSLPFHPKTSENSNTRQNAVTWNEDMRLGMCESFPLRLPHT